MRRPAGSTTGPLALATHSALRPANTHLRGRHTARRRRNPGCGIDLSCAKRLSALGPAG